MPAVIHCDHGPSFNELEKWCDSIGIEVYASMVGNARAKTIENAFSQCDNAITRYLKGYSGQNRTATGLVSSKPSERQETYGKRHSRSMNEAIEWLRTEGMAEWNEHIIETLERKPCGKTPYEL